MIIEQYNNIYDFEWLKYQPIYRDITFILSNDGNYSQLQYKLHNALDNMNLVLSKFGLVNIYHNNYCVRFCLQPLHRQWTRTETNEIIAELTAVKLT